MADHKLKYFNDFYENNFLEDLRSRLTKEKKPDGVISYLVGDTEAKKIFRFYFDKYLEIAYKHKIVDNDLKSRLHSLKWEIFFQAHQEIMSAFFMENIIRYQISFHPKGNKKSIGEFLIKTPSNNSIFIEVKSPYRKTPRQPWCGDDRDVIKQNIKNAVRQIPSTTKSIVVLAGDLKLPVSSDASGISEALYGEEYISIPYGGDSDEYLQSEFLFNPSGKYQPTINTRLSAVATLEDGIYSPYFNANFKDSYSERFLGKEDSDNNILPNYIFGYIFKIYHNPYCKYPIEFNFFKECPQFIPDIKIGRMKWINKDKVFVINDHEQQVCH